MGNTNKKIVFVIGGARSGKSSFALKGASGVKGRKAYIATSEAFDEEMKERIEKHKKQRPKDWDTFEEPLKVADVIKRTEGKYSAIIIDCLTLWLSNLMHDRLNIESEIERLISSLVTCQPSHVFIVSNEVGMGIVPKNKMARKFRDMAGMLNQKIAEIADEVYLMIAGIPVKIK